jgi:hypothetical protein
MDQLLKSSRAGDIGVRAPRWYPPIARLWHTPWGFAVLGGAGPATFTLDGYCGSQFARTTMAGAGVADITWLSNVVVVRRFDVDADLYRLDLYAPQELAPECPEAP